MTAEAEVIDLRQEKRLLQEQLARRDELIAQLQQEIVQLREQVQALQERVKKDSHNSHLPPSSDRFHRQPKSLRQKSGKQPGGQSGHPGHILKLSEPPDLVLVIEHQAQQKCCPRCQQVSSAPLPEDVPAPVQYGAAIGAVGIYLVQQQLLPYERACEVIEDLLGPSISVCTLAGLVERCAEQLESVEQQIKAVLGQADVLHQDETGLYVAGKRHWLHVSATEQLTHYAVHAKRGKEALNTIGILADFAGVSVHDGWKSYWQYRGPHALCNVHHLRELTFLEEAQQQEWAGHLKTLLLDSKAAVEQARAEGRSSLHPLEVADWKAQYAALLEEGYRANPPDPPPEVGKRGRRKQSSARNLLDRLSTHQEAVLRFLDNFAVPFDNSLAERDIRRVKVQQKVSGCFRSEAFAMAFCRIRGYLSTLRKQGLPVLTALEQALCGHPVFPAF